MDAKIEILRSDMNERFAQMDVKFETFRTEIRSDIADLKVDIHAAITSQTRWIFTSLLGMAAIMPILFKFMDKMLRYLDILF
ncbi:hypothetical protein LEP1GSC047_2058 [Leptospira inadai serovar Lyme str. 10]|uniref:Uncharacterized protein n=2 Tax=Leptospira inadai serovar Lyme TaxID=293084 RepID=V6HDN8_9LEPT|nr:hypothetical protein LEP1GSC047_2058 [Leptospira inadai serovar Lyme str. 10]